MGWKHQTSNMFQELSQFLPIPREVKLCRSIPSQSFEFCTANKCKSLSSHHLVSQGPLQGDIYSLGRQLIQLNLEVLERLLLNSILLWSSESQCYSYVERLLVIRYFFQSEWKTLLTAWVIDMWRLSLWKLRTMNVRPPYFLPISPLMYSSSSSSRQTCSPNTANNRYVSGLIPYFRNTTVDDLTDATLPKAQRIPTVLLNSSGTLSAHQ